MYASALTSPPAADRLRLRFSRQKTNKYRATKYGVVAWVPFSSSSFTYPQFTPVNLTKP